MYIHQASGRIYIIEFLKALSLCYLILKFQFDSEAFSRLWGVRFPEREKGEEKPKIEEEEEEEEHLKNFNFGFDLRILSVKGCERTESQIPSILSSLLHLHLHFYPFLFFFFLFSHLFMLHTFC